MTKKSKDVIIKHGGFELNSVAYYPYSVVLPCGEIQVETDFGAVWLNLRVTDTFNYDFVYNKDVFLFGIIDKNEPIVRIIPTSKLLLKVYNEI
jgi:hypothetical protein